MSLSESATLNNGQPALCPLSCPGDRVVYADRWQGTLDSPSADDIAWLAANPAPERVPTTEDLLDYELWLERLEVERECNARFG